MNDVSTLMFSSPFGAIRTMGDETFASDKYTVAITKAREIVQMHLTNKVAPRPETKAKIQSRTDRLLGFFLSQFQPEVTTTEVTATLSASRANTLDALNMDTLTQMGEGNVPVAIIRELFFKHRIAIDPKKLANWKSFSDRYERVLLAA